MSLPGETYEEKLGFLVVLRDTLVNINQTTATLCDRDKRLVISTNFLVSLEGLLMGMTIHMETIKKDNRNVCVDYKPILNNIREQIRIIIRCLTDIPAGGGVCVSGIPGIPH